MSTAIFHEEKCRHCGSEILFVERNCRTQEYLHHCTACGSFEAFDFRRNENGLIQKTVSIPISQIALTARIYNPEGKVNPVVWDAPLPADADTGFIYHYLNHQHTELRQSHPHFAGPDFDALEKQYDGQHHGGHRCGKSGLQHPDPWGQHGAADHLFNKDGEYAAYDQKTKNKEDCGMSLFRKSGNSGPM